MSWRWSHCGLLLGAVVLAGCTSTTPQSDGRAVSGQASPAGSGYKVGRPYQVKGVWYYPEINYDYIEDGVASWYGPGFDGRATANGETYDMNELTAAHRTLPLPSIVRVTNLDNGRSIKLRVNDRGPFVGARIIDVSRRAAQLLGFYTAGTAQVRVEIVEDDSRQLAAVLGAPAEALAPRAFAQRSETPAPSVIETAAAATPVEIGQVPVSTTAPLEVSQVPVSTAALLEIGQSPTSTEFEPVPIAAPVADVQPAPGEPVAPQDVLVASAVSYAPPPAGARSAYVQAGAFADPARAGHVRRRLAVIGPVVVSPSTIGGREILRVRVGPLQSDAEAGRVLQQVGQAGFPDCRLVYD